MIYAEPVYDLDTLAKVNLHIHTHYSHCAKREMLVPDIIRAAEKAGLTAIALTDHFNDADSDEAYMEQIDTLKNEAAGTGTDLKILFGFELSAYGIGKYREKIETNRALDYRLYSCNHFQQAYWEHPEDRSPRGYAEFSLAIVNALLGSGRADCVAHPLIGKYIKCFADRTEVSRAYKDSEIGDMAARARSRGVALELNTGAVLGDPALARRLWNLGREAGATFHFGTDAHSLDKIDTKTRIDEIKKILS